MEVNIKKVKGKNSNIATWILLIFAIAFFMSYPFHDSFLGGLISSLCCAAMIGGLADWFAVEALFRNPLNSRILAKLFRTEIIPKNRDRIFQALVDMVEKDLLTKESIKNKIEFINPSEGIIKLMKSEEKRDLLVLFDNTLKEILSNLSQKDLEKLEQLVDEIFKSNLEEIELSDVAFQSLEWTWNNGYKDKITDIVVDKIEELSKTREARILIQDAIFQILELNRGNFLVMILGLFIKGNLENISKSIQEKLVSYVAQMKIGESSEREKLQSIIRKQMSRLDEDEELKRRIEMWKNEKLEGEKNISKEIGVVLTQYISNLKIDSTKTSEFIEMILTIFQKQLEGFMDNEEKQLAFNKITKNLFEEIVEKNHHKIGLIVKEKLDGISGQELSAMIEPIIGNDLQLIRVNGSLIGALVGTITYILTFWIV